MVVDVDPPSEGGTGEQRNSTKNQQTGHAPRFKEMARRKV